MVVHSALPEPLTAAVEERLRAASVQHVAHGSARPMRAAEAAAGDPRSLALIGPYRSADVAEAVEATAPVGLPLLAPVATWAGVTRDDEPGCEDPAQHHGTILRLIARDTEVAARIAADVRSADRRAFVIAGEHSYGQQLDGQLRLAGLPRADDLAEADVIVLCGLAGEPEADRATALVHLPIIAFDGVQDATLDDAFDVRLALPIAPVQGLAEADLMAGVGQARRAAELIATGLRGGARDRASLLGALRALGPLRQPRGPDRSARVALARMRGLGTHARPASGQQRLSRQGPQAGGRAVLAVRWHRRRQRDSSQPPGIKLISCPGWTS